MALVIKMKKSKLLDNSLIMRLADHQFIDLLHELPDPDETLRKAGMDAQVYHDILRDPHIIGEVRQIYSGLLGFKYEIVAGDESSQAEQAREHFSTIFKSKPHQTMRWPDLLWSMGKAPLFGRRVHLIDWQLVDGKYTPSSITNLKNNQFAFNYNGDLLLRMADNVEGELAPEHRCLLTRHMPDKENPYGIALLSSCFWPWMFKNGGFKFFVKYCERFGKPFPIGKYPAGTTDSQINTLVDTLIQMLEDSVAGIPDDQSIELLTSSHSGELAQERLIVRCNNEFSKALTSQTAASELQKGSGSRAASETHKGRTDQNALADRQLVADTINQLSEMMTTLNFGEHVAPPVFQFVDKKQFNNEDVEYMAKSVALVPIKKSEIYSRLGFTEPSADDDVVYNPAIPASAQPFDPNKEGNDFAKSQALFSSAEKEWQLIDQSISAIVEQVKSAINAGSNYNDALNAIVSLMPDLNTSELDNLLRQELELEFGAGMLEEQA